MIHPRIDELLDRVEDSRYALVIVAAKRAARSTTTTISWARESGSRRPSAALIESRSKNYLTMAMEEIAGGKITYHLPPA